MTPPPNDLGVPRDRFLTTVTQGTDRKSSGRPIEIDGKRFLNDRGNRNMPLAPLSIQHLGYLIG